MGLRNSIKIKHTISTNTKGIYQLREIDKLESELRKALQYENEMLKAKNIAETKAQIAKGKENEAKIEAELQENYAKEAELLEIKLNEEIRLLEISVKEEIDNAIEAEKESELQENNVIEAKRIEKEMKIVLEKENLKLLQYNSNKDLEERRNNTTVIELPCRFEVLYENDGLVILNLWPIDGIVDENLEQIIDSIKDSFHVINILREDVSLEDSKKKKEVLTGHDMKTHYDTQIYDGDNIECIICLGEISKGTEIRRTKCGHIFHNWCLAEWAMVYHASCPQCRESLITT